MEEHDVVVALANPANVPKLMRLGCMMARQFEGRVVAATVVTVEGPPPDATPRPDRMGRAQELLRLAEETAGALGARFDARVALARGIEDVVDEIAEARHAKAIIMGYSEREHPVAGRGYDRLVDDVATHAPCSLVVARFRDGGEQYRRVLVPVARTLNMDVRRDLLAALHHQAGAEIDLVHYAGREEEARHMGAAIQQWLVERGVSEWVRPRVAIHPDPGQAIVEACGDYDAVVLGTAPLHTLRRRLFGSVPEYVAEHAGCTTLIVRQHEGVLEY